MNQAGFLYSWFTYKRAGHSAIKKKKKSNTIFSLVQVRFLAAYSLKIHTLTAEQNSTGLLQAALEPAPAHM